MKPVTPTELTDERLRQLRDEALAVLRDVDIALTRPGRLTDTPDGDRITHESAAARQRIADAINARKETL